MTAAGTTGRLVVAAVLGALALLATGAGEARAAGLGCGESSLEQPFLRWLDPLRYELVPGGDFEGSMSGWALSGGARVVSGNESFYVGGADDSHSLLLPVGSSATSPPLCVGVDGAFARLFTRGGGGLLSGLRVQVVYRSLLGIQLVTDTLPALPSSGWQPTLPLPVLANVTGLLSLDGVTTEIRLRFTPTGLFAKSFQIDDVYVDPWVEH